jgi:hypothetical protein
MIAKRAEARLWTLLARVRDLRVRRRHVALARAEDKARAAAAEVAAQRAARDAHAQQLAPLLRGCAHGDKAAAIWRQTFAHHQARALQFEREIASVSSREADARAELRRARLALRREMLSRTDAENRARQIAYELLDDG